MINIKEIAKKLAKEHKEDCPSIKEVYLCPHPTELILVEIDSEALRDKDIFPFKLAADPPDIPIPYVVIIINEIDWQNRNSLWPNWKSFVKFWPECENFEKIE